MQRALQAKNFKIPLDQLSTYLSFATKRAQETGQSVDYLVDSIVTGLGRQSVLILDNLGISANEIRSEMESAGSMAAAVGGIIRREMGDASTATEAAAIKAGQLNAAWSNFMAETGKGGTLSSFKTGLTVMLNDFTAAMKSESMTGLDKFLVFTGIDRTPLLKYNDEVYRTAKASKEAEVASDGMMRSIESVEQAQRVLNSMTKTDNREWAKLFKGKLESYIAEEKAAKQQEIWRNNSINGIKQQIDELQKLADEETNLSKKRNYANDILALKQKLTLEQNIYDVKKRVDGTGERGSIAYSEAELKNLEKSIKLVVTDKERSDLQAQIDAKKFEINAMLNVRVESKTERQTIEDAIKQYEDMQLAIPVGVGTPEDIAAAQAEWDRLAAVIKQAKEELEKFPKAPEITPPKGSLAAYDEEIARLAKDMSILTGKEYAAALASKDFQETLRDGAASGWRTTLEQETDKLNNLTTALASATEERKKWLEGEIEAQQAVVDSLNGADSAMKNAQQLSEEFAAILVNTSINSLQLLADSLAGLSDASPEEAIANLLMPFADMAISAGVIIASTGKAIQALKKSLMGFFGGDAVLAGAALIAVGVAAKAGLGALAKGGVSKGSGASNSNTFTGGYSSEGSSSIAVNQMQFASPEPQIVVLETKVSGSDLVFVADREKARRGK